MAEQERLTKKERREAARAARKQQEAEAAKQAKRRRLTSTLVTVLVLALIGAVVAQALFGGEEAVAEEISGAAYDQAVEAAGCEVVDDTALGNAEHLDPASAPPADQLYADAPRPTHSGPHFLQPYPPVSSGLDEADERQLTHNLEHGAVIAWYDPAQVDGDTVAAMEAWAESLNDSGFTSDGGGAIFVAPFEGIGSGKPIALRAWGLAVDCAEWNETAASGFVIENYGTHGDAPENFISPYPEEVLGFSDREVGESVNQDRMDDGATETATETTSPTDGGS